MLGEKRVWALEDVRGVSRSLERSLVARGERVVRVPPKLMAGARRGGRSYGKSDSIDARAALAHPDLPAAVEDQAAREIKLLVDHRDTLVRQRSEPPDGSPTVKRRRWRTSTARLPRRPKRQRSGQCDHGADLGDHREGDRRAKAHFVPPEQALAVAHDEAAERHCR